MGATVVLGGTDPAGSEPDSCWKLGEGSIDRKRPAPAFEWEVGDTETDYDNNRRVSSLRLDVGVLGECRERWGTTEVPGADLEGLIPGQGGGAVSEEPRGALGIEIFS